MVIRAGRWRGLGPWIVLVVVATVFSGIPGHIVPWFSGDLAYHIGVSRTVGLTHVSGFGPYDSLPSYYGGTFSLALKLSALLSVRPETALAVVSWFEPGAWVACAGYFAGGLWPASRARQLSFVVLLITTGGFGATLLDTGVNAPNVASQVFWPLYPRDVAIMLSLLSVGAAVRGRWVPAGLLLGIAIATQVQIAVFAGALVVTAFLVVGGNSGLTDRLRRSVFAVGIATVISAWWWIPRLVWVLSYGVGPRGGTFEGDVTHSWTSVVAAYGVVLPMALLGLAFAVKEFREQSTRFLLVWVCVVGAAGILSLAAPSELLSFRRSLLLAAVPVAALAAVVICSLCERLSMPWTGWGVVLLTAALVAPSLPALLRTRTAIEREFAAQTVATFAYPNQRWSAVWSQLGRGRGQILAPPRDASVAWFQTGRPVAYAIRPGYIKTWFNVGKATGWAEAARQAKVQRAFSNDLPAMCSLMRSHRIGRALLRSEPGMVGATDLAGRTALSSLVTHGEAAAPRGSLDQTVVLEGPARMSLDASLTKQVRLLQVWQPGRSPRPAFALRSKGRRVRVVTHARDGALTRFAVAVPTGTEGISLVPRPGRRLAISRVIGYRPFPGVPHGPAAVLTAGEVCLQAGADGHE